MVTRKSGSLEATFAPGPQPRVPNTRFTIPAHSSLKVGTLSGILLEIATYLGMSKEVLARELFG
jgi:hypothetical protein